MKNLIQLTLLAFVFFSALVNAHSSGHDKPQTIYEEQAITTASQHVKRLIEKGEIDKSWEMIKASNAVLERKESRMNWIVTFNNPKEADKNKKSLSIFLTNTGYFLSLNFTGK